MVLEGKGEAWQNWTRVRGEEEPPGGVALGEVEPHLKSRGGREEACLGMIIEEKAKAMWVPMDTQTALQAGRSFSYKGESLQAPTRTRKSLT